MNASKNSSKKSAKTRKFSKAEATDLVDAILPPESDRPQRQLTHALTYDKKTDRWSCQCGYVLGDGHHALYALCPLSHRDKIVNQQRESLSSNEDKLLPKLKQTALDLFDLAP